jgi:hypothetical protein
MLNNAFVQHPERSIKYTSFGYQCADIAISGDFGSGERPPVIKLLVMHKGRIQQVWFRMAFLRLGLFHHVVIHNSLLLHELYDSSGCAVLPSCNTFETILAVRQYLPKTLLQ